MVERMFNNVVCDDPATTARWYCDLFGFVVAFESDWFVHLQDPARTSLELGLLARGHSVVAEPARQQPVGGITTIVVDDVDVIHQRAIELGATVDEEPTDLFYGQRRMVLTDPAGQLVDVSSPCPPDPDWLASLEAS